MMIGSVEKVSHWLLRFRTFPQKSILSIDTTQKIRWYEKGTKKK
jgi:hypothetical protein